MSCRFAVRRVIILAEDDADDADENDELETSS